eukprot:Gb_14651 [translate_table: standard]
MDEWQALTLVFAKLDGRSLARASCVSKAWSHVSRQKDLWRELCLSKWPSLDSESGAFVVKEAGGHMKLYALRYEAQQKSPLKDLKPRLSMENLIFMLDVSYRDEVLCSLIRKGDELGPVFMAGNAQGLFHFTVDVYNWEGAEAVGWDIHDVKDFKVSWAMMVKGCHKVFQLLHTTRPGHTMGHTCNFSDTLPAPPALSTGSYHHVAEVNLVMGCAASGGANLRLCQLCFCILNTVTWRYFSQNDALTYFQHAFLI